MSKVHCFQHVSFEDMGCMEEWFLANDFQISYTRFFQNDSIPDVEEYDWLVIVGGPMGIYDETEHPWLIKEKLAIRDAIEANKIVLGICLGAQLLADVLGAKVYKNQYKEIGWWNIQLSDDDNFLNTDKESEYSIFHWHGDTFDLPEDSVLLASSAACKNQAFRLGENVLALQFHFEVTEKNLKRMLEHGVSELNGGKYIQSAGQILAKKQLIEENNQRMFSLLKKMSLQID